MCILKTWPSTGLACKVASSIVPTDRWVSWAMKPGMMHWVLIALTTRSPRRHSCQDLPAASVLETLLAAVLEKSASDGGDSQYLFNKRAVNHLSRTSNKSVLSWDGKELNWLLIVLRYFRKYLKKF